MKKLITVILSSFALLIVFFSCEKDDNENDKIAPIISEIRINFEDTIIHNGEIFYVNRNPEALIDTLIPGRAMRITARFQDNKEKGLSSYMIKLRYDSILDPSAAWVGVDTFLTATDSWKNIFGRTDTLVVNQSDVYIRPFISVSREGIYKELPYREGEYFLIVGCVDKAGNETLVEHRLVMMYSETIASHIVP